MSNQQTHDERLKNELQLALARVLKSLVFRGDPASPLNELPISQLKCLHIVSDSEGQKMIDIAHRLEIGLPAASQIVDRLVRRGLLERRPDPLDRRVVRVGLTHTASGLVADARQHRQERMDATLEGLDSLGLSSVLDGLELLARAAEQVEAAERLSAPDHHAEGQNAAAELRPLGTADQDLRSDHLDPLIEMIADGRRSRRFGPGMLPTRSAIRP